MVGYSEKWTREITNRYESEGAEGLGGNQSQHEYGPDVKPSTGLFVLDILLDFL